MAIQRHVKHEANNVVIAIAPIMDVATSDLRLKLLIRVICGVRHLNDQDAPSGCGHLTISCGELLGIGGFDCCIDRLDRVGENQRDRSINAGLSVGRYGTPGQRAA
jgi:hypothetical protein